MNPTLLDCCVAFTSPVSYGEFLRSQLESAGAIPLWVPTISIQQSDRLQAKVRQVIAAELHQISGLAFTSRNGIRAVASALSSVDLPPLRTPFYLGALGRDAQLLSSLTEIYPHPHCQVVVPPVATPEALVEALGPGQGRPLLCPVPRVVGLTEPAVIPNFLKAIAHRGWRPLRLDAYETIWCGADCAAALVQGGRVSQPVQKAAAIILTSTAEVEGLLKSLRALQIDPHRWLQGVVVAAHGPVTAQGIRAQGVQVQVVSSDSSSFAGVVQALGQYFQKATQCSAPEA
ncbi:uroporphyrinogen-III synthase [Lyngbya confervoides]|uniref:Uroporphyrinogen-III synthase n=1 Tax=Lyngbya confervoides BDU141951 TaxID=1574623 RepID=A0ABD4T7H8_9CYAN|nr:uroporphyrinogen-III synthase [Lyngbya confervoides]MCM1984491.1 uroporphyrinogen-III synthase [Lyngbya confervoides BDU141951]